MNSGGNDNGQNSPRREDPATLSDIEHGELHGSLGPLVLRLARDGGVGHTKEQGASRTLVLIRGHIAGERLGGSGNSPENTQEVSDG